VRPENFYHQAHKAHQGSELTFSLLGVLDGSSFRRAETIASPNQKIDRQGRQVRQEE
jgi:hypothetical protein